MSLHSFDPEVARIVGVNAAVLHQNLSFWAQKNAANEKHMMDGRVWTYNSRRAFAVLFPYLTDSQIKTALSKLIDAGLLIKGEYNKAKYDRTCWYSPVPIGDLSPMEGAEIANGMAIDRQPIPDRKPDIKQVLVTAGESGGDLFGKIDPPPDPSKKVHLPEGWVPGDDDLAYAREKGLNDSEIKEMADEFKGYWLERTDAKAKRTADGWRRTWQGWVRRDAPGHIRNRRMGGGAIPLGSRGRHTMADEVARRRAQREAQGNVSSGSKR